MRLGDTTHANREARTPPRFLRERVILGPCKCQGCGLEVAYVMADGEHVGWLHPDGRFRCRYKHSPR